LGKGDDKMKNISNTIVMVGMLSSSLVLSAAADESNVSSQARSFLLPQHGNLMLHVPSTWKQDVRRPPNNLPPTITLSPEKGDAFIVMITPLWSPQNDPTFNKPEAVKRLIEANLKEMLPSAVEKQVSIQEFNGTDGTGYYFLVTDKAPGTDEYPYAIRAGIGVDDLLLSVTVLCRSKDTVGITGAINALEKAELKKK
jgi:hypothetical protein